MSEDQSGQGEAPIDRISPATRTWIYRIASAAVPVLVVAGAVAQDQATVWLNLAAAVLGLGGSGTALAHRPTKAS